MKRLLNKIRFLVNNIINYLFHKRFLIRTNIEINMVLEKTINNKMLSFDKKNKSSKNISLLRKFVGNVLFKVKKTTLKVSSKDNLSKLKIKNVITKIIK